MKSSYTLKGLLAAGLVAGAMSQAYASPLFTVNTTLFDGAPGKTFDADFLSGNSTSLLTATGPNTVSGQGFTQYGNFVDQNGPGQLQGATTNLGSTYILWAEYSFSTTVTSGSNLQPGSISTINSLTFKLYGEVIDANPLNNSTFSFALVSDPNSAKVTHGANVKLLGEGELAAPPGGLQNVATLNTGGGSSFNSVVDFGLTADGMSFFIAPDPFYDRAFSSFTNTGGGVTVGTGLNAGRVALRNAGGGNDFFNTPTEVPEPASMALIGLGLVGLAAVRRRQIKK